MGVAVVALTAAVISFEHVRTLALHTGETELTSWLLPISIDGAVVAAVAVLLADSRAGRRPTALTLMLLAAGLTSSLAANIASAEPGPAARAVAAWPPVALALGIEVLAGLVRRSRPKRHQPDTADPVGRDTAAEAAMPVAAGTWLAPAAETVGRLAPAARYRDDAPALAVIRRLDDAAPDGKASRLQIQAALGCGGSRAARLAQLARRS